MTYREQLIILIQFIALGYLIITEPLEIFGSNELLLYGIGLILGIWALWTMRVSKLRITPAVAPGSTLIMHGPYKYIRHPMDAALIILTIGTLLHSATMDRVLVAGILWADILLKIQIEERHLQAAFSEYLAYGRKTKKLIPFIY